MAPITSDLRQKDISFETLNRRLINLLSQPLNELNPEDSVTRLAESRSLLELLPMTTSEYDVANARINNALRYLASGEFGAARYELKLLVNRMNTLQTG